MSFPTERPARRRQPKRWVTQLDVILFAIPLFLMGCKEALYSDLDEIQINEMVAILQAAGIASTRERDKDGAYALHIDQEAIGVAVVLLRKEGYPKRKYQNLGEIFREEGIAGTPFEERARFMHALNEELSQTISEIAGVRSARVHVMIPAQDRFAETQLAAKASVALHHEPDFLTDSVVPTIKTLIAHSVPQLEYEAVSVALFPVGGVEIARTRTPLAANAVEAGQGQQDRTLLNEISMPLSQFGWTSERTSAVVVIGLLLTFIVGMSRSFLRRRSAGADR